MITKTARMAFPILLLALAGCSSSNAPERDPNVMPVKYKEEILLTIQPLLSDPTNIRDAGITDPMLRPAGRDQRYAVCVRANPRDPDRKYMGVQYRIGWFYDGTLNQLVDATPEQCAGMPFKPFLELEQLCMAKKCD